MRDSEIVALLADGDPRGLEAAYAAYADRIHDYARGLLRSASPDTAADVTHDTFLIALAKASGLRDRDKLRPWLYAIARNECLRVLRTSKRSAPLENAPEPTAEGSAEMSQGLAATERRALVLAAAEGLSPKDREVFELGMRHDLAAREVAAALGVSDNAAHAMLSRVRAQFERSLGALLVARQGRGTCAALNELLAGWDGSFDALWRKRIARHVTGCAACTSVERRELSPAALLAVLPLVPAPALLRSRLFQDNLGLVAAARDLAERAGPWDADGFPGEAPAGRRRPALLAMLAVIVLLFGVVISVRLLTQDTVGDVAAPVVSSPTTSQPHTTSYAVGGQATLRARPSRKPSPTPTPTPSETTSAPATSAPPAPVPQPEPTRTTRTPKPTTAVPVGTLRVTPSSATLRPGESVTVRLTAVGGPVSWTSTADSYLTLSLRSGRLASGASVSVVITLSRTTPLRVIVQAARFNGTPVTISVCHSRAC